jgi:hypothetical protein
MTPTPMAAAIIEMIAMTTMISMSVMPRMFFATPGRSAFTSADVSRGETTASRSLCSLCSFISFSCRSSRSFIISSISETR